MSFEIAILGGGLAGWALQEALQANGLPAREILLLETALTGSGSSGVLHGMMHPLTGRSLFPKPGYLEAWYYSRQWFAQLQAQFSASHCSPTLYTELPLWRVALNAAVDRQYSRSFARASATVADYPLHPLPLPTWLAEAGVLSAYALSPALQVNLPLVLAQLAAQSQIQRVLRAGPIWLSDQKDHWQIHTATTSYRAAQIVFACGRGMQGFFPHLSMSYKRGEVVILKSPLQLPALFSGGGIYIAPLGPGHLITGATIYHAERAWSPQQSWQDLQSRLDWLPGLREAVPVQIWGGIRTVVHPDREALLGPIPGLSRASIMNAFGTRGLLQIPLSAQMLADYLLHQTPLKASFMLPQRLPEATWHFNPQPDPR